MTTNHEEQPHSKKNFVSNLFNNPPEEKDTNQAIRYLQHCVRKLENKHPALHNYLLSLYAKDKDELPLLKFLSQKETYYDLKYALRLCTKENKTTACVHIYSAMGLYEEAVELAMKVDLQIAKENADKPEDDDALRKKLWLKIAKHLVVEHKNIKKAMELLSQCDLLKIEDILPFFPDFTRIDDFKEEICSSLEDYNRHIEELKVEMEEATKSADLIRQDIKDMRNNYGFVTTVRNCDLCNYAVLTREFYLFPCGHVYHATCLRNEMVKYLDKVQKARVTELMTLISQMSSDSIIKKKQTLDEKSETNVTVTVNQIDSLKDELDDYVASECPYCGDIIIKSIAEPFVQLDEIESLSWVI